MGAPYGPIRITKVRQVSIPVDLMRAVGLEVGDLVHFRQSDDDPYILELVPSDVLERRYMQGRGSDAAAIHTDDQI